jgi:hypothetical protein
MAAAWTSRIQKWHFGKLIILWAWLGSAAAVLLSNFLARNDVTDRPIASCVEFVSLILLLLAPTVVTWIWLGAKERA